MENKKQGLPRRKIKGEKEEEMEGRKRINFRVRGKNRERKKKREELWYLKTLT